jgi:hypothetical protein
MEKGLHNVEICDLQRIGEGRAKSHRRFVERHA